MNRKILCVDDEPNVLRAYKRGLRAAFAIEIATGGAEALQLIESRGPYAVIVSDMRMPEMDGIELLNIVKARVPDTVRIMLTGNADQQTAIDAVNQGEIFRFLNKPCQNQDLARSLEAGVTQHRLVTVEKELLRKTLRGSIQVLSEVLSLVNPTAFGRTRRVTGIVLEIAQVMQLDDAWQLETAALLSQLGCVILPESLLDKVSGGRALSAEEIALYHRHPNVGADLLAKIPRLEEIKEVIQYQEKNFDGSGIPCDDRSGVDIPLGARLLKVALDIDRYEAAGLDRGQVIARLIQHPHYYDPDILSAFETIVQSRQQTRIVKVRLAQLAPGMVLAADVNNSNGMLVVSKGQAITPIVRERLISFARTGHVVEPILVEISSSCKAPGAGTGGCRPAPPRGSGSLSL